jgi:hypothetical protein
MDNQAQKQECRHNRGYNLRYVRMPYGGYAIKVCPLCGHELTEAEAARIDAAERRKAEKKYGPTLSVR